MKNTNSTACQPTKHNFAAVDVTERCYLSNSTMNPPTLNPTFLMFCTYCGQVRPLKGQ